MEKEQGAELINSHGSSYSRGVAILIKNCGVDCNIQQKILDPLGRYIILKVNIEDKNYVLINLYATNKGNCLLDFFF